MYKIYMFGTPRIYNNGELIRISRRKSFALLAVLAVSGVPHSRDELATLLYPGHDQSGARNNLRRDFFDLKELLDEDILLLGREQVSLKSSGKLWVDVKEFLDHIDYVHQHNQSHQADKQGSICDVCQARLTQAVELYSGEFMSGFTIAGSREFEDWQFFQSENLRRALSEIFPQLIKWHSDRGEFEPAINYTRRWLSLNFLNEPAQRQMLRLYAWSGQPAAALRQYSEFKRQLQAEFGAEPEEETNALYESILSHKIVQPNLVSTKKTSPLSSRYSPSQLPNNLPIPGEPLIGRERELELNIHKLRDDPDCRMLTIVGLGGIGKTRLAIESALRLSEEDTCPFCEGIFYVSLVALSTPEEIIPAIAEALKLPLLPDPEQRTQQLLDYLNPKRLLLLLDNFEHLVNAHSVQLLVDLLAYAPHLKLLITSRTRLNAHFEHVITLHGLDVPISEADYQDQPVESLIAGYSAIQLFIQRARHLKPDFTITNSNLMPVVQICQMVDGMPLGIELATTWLEVLTPAEITMEIKHCLDFLAAKWPDRPERQHSLRAVFDSSWRLLTKPESAALMDLTIFQGSFSREAAQGISGASIQLLLTLQNKSWLQVQNNGRYQIHELLRQYANEKLQDEPGTWQLARESFCTYYADFLDQQAEYIRGTKQREAFDSITNEYENIRLAWQWLVESDQVELAVQRMLPALFRYAEARAMPFELTRFLDLAIERVAKDTCSSTNPHLKSILRTARAAFNRYGYALRINAIFLSRDQEETVRQVWSSSGNVKTLRAMGFWGILLPFLYGLLVETQAATSCLQELISHFREQHQQWELAYALYLLGGLLEDSSINHINPISNQTEASQLLLEALSIFQELGDKSESGYTMDYIAVLYLLQGKYLQAVEQWQKAQANLKEVGEWIFYASIYMGLADVYDRLGEHESVFQNFRDAKKAFSEVGHIIGAAIASSSESIHALRYSDIQHARRTRQESLALYQEAGNALGIAWSYWEVGEINRVAGDLLGAKEGFEKARILFENLDDPTSPIFIQRGLGDISQAIGDFNEAKRYFEESFLKAQQTNHKWAVAYALSSLGRAEVALGEVKSAREHFSQAIQTAQSIDQKSLVLKALAGYAGFFASLDKFEQAVELGSLVINHKLSWNETKAQMLALLQSIKSLPPDRSSAAQVRGHNLDIEAAIIRFNLLTG